MSMKSGMNVRLPDDLRARLDRVAEASGLKAADLVRMATEAYCAKVESEGRITLFLNEASGVQVGGVGNVQVNSGKPAKYQKTKKTK